MVLKRLNGDQHISSLLRFRSCSADFACARFPRVGVRVYLRLRVLPAMSLWPLEPVHLHLLLLIPKYLLLYLYLEGPKLLQFLDKTKTIQFINIKIQPSKWPARARQSLRDENK